MQDFGSTVLGGDCIAGLGFSLCFLLVSPAPPVGVNKQWHKVYKNLYQSYAVVCFICSL